MVLFKFRNGTGKKKAGREGRLFVDFAAEEDLAVFLERGHGLDGLAVEVEPLHERGEFGIPCGHL